MKSMSKIITVNLCAECPYVHQFTDKSCCTHYNCTAFNGLPVNPGYIADFCPLENKYGQQQ